MDLGLGGRVAFVAAASKGMGRAIAETFASEGAHVGMCARGEDALNQTAAAVRSHGVRSVAAVADLSVPGQGAAAVERTVAEFGRLDALLVNAGGPPRMQFEAIDEAQWEATFRLTFLSAVELVRAALPALRRSDAAAIVFLQSSTIAEPIDGLTLSNAIRPAVRGLAKTLSRELAPEIRVNTLLPGRIRTDRMLDVLPPGADVDKLVQAMAAGVPLGRIGTAMDFARVAVFLCSPAASYVTGTTLAVDGGLIHAT